MLRERERGRLHLHRIKSQKVRWIQGDDKISKATNCHQTPHGEEDFGLHLIIQEDYDILVDIPHENEIKVFSMSVDSSDACNGKFFQNCWSITFESFVRNFLKGKNPQNSSPHLRD